MSHVVMGIFWMSNVVMGTFEMSQDPKIQMSQVLCSVVVDSADPGPAPGHSHTDAGQAARSTNSDTDDWTTEPVAPATADMSD